MRRNPIEIDIKHIIFFLEIEAAIFSNKKKYLPFSPNAITPESFKFIFSVTNNSPGLWVFPTIPGKNTL